VDTMAAALLGGLFLALALWLWHHAWWRRLLAVGCLVVATGLALWRPAAGGGAEGGGPDRGVAWSPAALEELRRAGRPVFVDVTADWCITCIANEQAVLYTEEIQAAFAAAGVTYMVADWTNYDPRIASFLGEHGRSGIPLYLLYPADASRPALILPQLLRKQTVLEALATLEGENAAVASSL
jgi:thiol:disulfide interchange protein